MRGKRKRGESKEKTGRNIARNSRDISVSRRTVGSTAFYLQLVSSLMTIADLRARARVTCTDIHVWLRAHTRPRYISHTFSRIQRLRIEGEKARNDEREREEKRRMERTNRERQRRWTRKDGEDLLKKKKKNSPFPYSRAESLPFQRRSTPRNECNVHPVHSRSPFSSLLFPFDPPPFSSLPSPPRIFIFIVGAVGRYVAYAHHAPTVPIPPISRLAAGHFGPCGGCAFIPRLCLPPHIGDLRLCGWRRMVACECAS